MDHTLAKAHLELMARIEDRLVLGDEAAAAREVLRTAKMGYVAMSTSDWPYIVPIAYAYDGTSIHFHGGAGLTSALLAEDPRVCLLVTTSAELLKADVACDYNFRYESVLAFGMVQLLEDEADRERAMREIVAKYDPAAKDMPFIPDSFSSTVVYRLTVDALTYRRAPEI